MVIFREREVGINQLLEVVSEALLNHLSQNSKVDYYSKVLQSKKLFYLLMYGILENDRFQRTLEDTFNDPVFKMLFNFDASESVRRSLISEIIGYCTQYCQESGLKPRKFLSFYSILRIILRKIDPLSLFP